MICKCPLRGVGLFTYVIVESPSMPTTGTKSGRSQRAWPIRHTNLSKLSELFLCPRRIRKNSHISRSTTAWMEMHRRTSANGIAR